MISKLFRFLVCAGAVMLTLTLAMTSAAQQPPSKDGRPASSDPKIGNQ